MRELRGKKVFITGGAQGIGREIALAFAAEGAGVLLGDVDRETLDKTRNDIAGGGVTCQAYLMDVTDQSAIERVRDEIGKDFGPIDILVNNAGVVFGGPFLEIPLERHMATYRTNIEGLVMVTYAFLPMLLERGSAHLVNIASASGLIGLPNGSTYASSKWAAIGFSESIRLELKHSRNGHVKVTTVCPSYVNTGMFDGVEPPRLTRMLDPAKLTRKILQAVKHDRPFVLEPWLVKVTPLLKGVLPSPAFDLISGMFRATSGMNTWHGHRN